MKFWAQSDVSWLTQERDKKFAVKGADHDMFLHVGFFTFSYAMAELRLTLLLAKATKITNLLSFDLLTRGMDVRVKIERLRRACQKGPPIGPNLCARLSIMDGTMRTFRNQIAHSATAPNPDKQSISLVSLAAMPAFVSPRLPDQEVSAKIEMLDLFEYCAWLRCFEEDLKSALHGLASLGMFEISHPQSPLLRGSDQPRDQPKRPSKLGRRERKRARKEQSLRGSRRP